ncbi:ABC transporter ATP-binding protein [Candidatus Woesearchaeota archaeon]|nr:ABC transporter ATP-binding protein [Candidatus Woesearchaeota archaeon]
MATPIIKLKNITKKFGKKVVLDNLNLEINQGEIFGLIGMSGSGKTTLLNTLIGYYEPEQGDILFYSKEDQTNKSLFKNMLEVRKMFGFAPQSPSFYPKLTVEENLAHFGSLYHLSKETIQTNINHLLDLTELTQEREQIAQTLSGGMQKRLSIACSLIHNPKVLILDEPTADLDPILRKETWQLLKGIHRLGTTVIVATHLLSELEDTCDRVSILHNSRIIKIGTVEQLKNAFTQNKEIQITTSLRKYDKIAKELSKYSSLSIKRMFLKDNKLNIHTPDAESTLQHLLHITKKTNESIIELNVEKPSLEEIFESISHSRKKEIRLKGE